MKQMPDNRLEGSTPIEQARIVMIGLLDQFNRVCKENNLSYWIEGGTLLGAVRTGKFIPWDDDIDVVMPEEDYNKFISLSCDTFPEYIYVEKLDEYAKLHDRYSKRIDEFIDNDKMFNSIFIDIFPMFKYSTGKKVLKRFKRYLTPYPPSTKNKIKLCFFYFLKFSGIGYILNTFCKLGIKNWYGYSQNLPWSALYSSKWIFPLSEITFEGKTYPAPHNTIKYLTELYGVDYMLPKPDNHHNNITIYPTTPCINEHALSWEKDFS